MRESGIRWGLSSVGVVAMVALADLAACGSDAPREPFVVDEAVLNAELAVLTGSDRAPGAVIAIRDRYGRSVTLRSGTAELGTERAMLGEDAQFRAGSITKTFTALSVLQLVASGAIDLDHFIAEYLPGVVAGTAEGAAIDGREISLRHLLQHTSGLPNYTDFIEEIPDDPVAVEDQVALSLAHSAEFTPPGSNWSYTNTGYLILGMLVERITGESLGHVFDERILRPAELSSTYWPPPGERALRGTHAHNYLPAPDGSFVDVTELEPSIGGPAGQLVSTPSDLNRFWQAVFDGDILAQPLLDEMLTTVSLPDRFGAGAGYGLGIYRLPLPCGGFYWGHGGDHLGVEALSGRDTRGRQVTAYITRRQGEETSEHLKRAVEAAFCSGQ